MATGPTSRRRRRTARSTGSRLRPACRSRPSPRSTARPRSAISPRPGRKCSICASLVAAGSYPSLRTHYATVGLYNFAVAHRDLPDDLVYAIVDAAFANQELLIEAHPAAAETTPANLSRNSFLPFHGGAARWYHNKSASGVIRGD